MIALHHTAMPMTCVSTQADVRNHEEIGKLLFDRPDRPLDNTIIGIGLRAHLILSLRNPEQDYTRYSKALRLFDLLNDMINGELELPHQGRNRDLYPLPRADE